MLRVYSCQEDSDAVDLDRRYDGQEELVIVQGKSNLEAFHLQQAWNFDCGCHDHNKNREKVNVEEIATHFLYVFLIVNRSFCWCVDAVRSLIELELEAGRYLLDVAYHEQEKSDAEYLINGVHDSYYPFLLSHIIVVMSVVFKRQVFEDRNTHEYAGYND